MAGIDCFDLLYSALLLLIFSANTAFMQQKSEVGSQRSEELKQNSLHNPAYAPPKMEVRSLKVNRYKGGGETLIEK